MNGKLIIWILYAACAAALIAEFFIHRHMEHPWEALPEFYPLFGFIALVAIVMGAKALRTVVKRDPNYYEDDARAGSGQEGSD